MAVARDRWPMADRSHCRVIRPVPPRPRRRHCHARVNAGSAIRSTRAPSCFLPSPSAPQNRLLEDPEVAEEPPEKDEDEDGAEAATAQLLGAVTGGETTKKFAHDGWRPEANVVHNPLHCCNTNRADQWAEATSVRRRARFSAAATARGGLGSCARKPRRRPRLRSAPRPGWRAGGPADRTFRAIRFRDTAACVRPRLRGC
jgi:hypothetical protein